MAQLREVPMSKQIASFVQKSMQGLILNVLALHISGDAAGEMSQWTPASQLGFPPLKLLRVVF